jgi:hypothetical protein
MATKSASNELTGRILAHLFERGIFAWRQNSSGVFNFQTHSMRPSPKVGVSDILGSIPPNGRLLALEVKVGKDRLRPEQEGFLASVTKSGGFSMVAHTFEQFLKEFNP